MRRVIRVLAAGGLVIAATWRGVAVQAQHSRGLNTTQTIQISSATKTLDLGSNDENSAPPNWTAASFDDSAWSPASQVSSDVIACAVQNQGSLSPLQGAPFYWGANEGDHYLFRQTFTLPKAKGYYGSTIAFGGDTHYDPAFDIYVDGNNVDSPYAPSYKRDAIGQNLHSGNNVVAIYAGPTGDNTSSNEPCSALTFTLNLVITGIQTNAPTPHPTTFSTILPGQNAVLSGSSTLPFSWNRYAGARYYYLQFWLANPAAGQRITSRSVTTYTARLSGTSYTLSTHAMPKGTYQWRMAAVSGSGKLLSPWTAEQTVTLK